MGDRGMLFKARLKGSNVDPLKRMTLDDLKADLTSRLGKTVDALCTREGMIAIAIEDLYQPSPAGFGGKLFLKDGSQFAWELWLEDGESWNFHARPLGGENLQ